ncbi:serine/threonine-protein kinase nak1 [Apiospora phragmitis]|uniref:non-specific serine/threonine protein kinase n=1 Tax=Apiospora phragmitis TaxID=2905665 RepID=A0ABR1VSE4_9PEZI
MKIKSPAGRDPHLSIQMGNIAYHEFLAETRVTAATPTLDPRQIANMETRRAMMDDAKAMQTATELACREAGRSAPPYLLSELIGKGSYGRVYKATDRQTGGVVAIKMVDIEEGDGVKPGSADTYGDIQKEIRTLKLLRDVGAANVNLVVDAFMVAQFMWIVTDYCAGGSVATLMKPFMAAASTPGNNGNSSKGPRLDEKWIIPILREVAEAVRWIHTHGVIHRDIKCANIFVTQEGGVQLGDFGVAAMVQTKFDKRCTVIGTLHWMAPELFESVVSYGPAVDIWAFGAVAYEMASGLPPNALESHRARVDPSQFGQFLNGHIPRLEGPEYSDGLKDLVAFCLEKSPDRRPTIERVADHAYIRNTSLAYPADSLSQLVRNYRLWEQQGGVRQSLLNPNIGAQVAADRTAADSEQDEWNFRSSAKYDTPAAAAEGQAPAPSHVLERLKAPLEKVFDPNTRTNYTENSRTYYAGDVLGGGDGGGDGSGSMLSSSTPDLPLRDDSSTAAIRESLIDLDASLGDGFDTPTSSMDDMTTLRPAPRAFPHSAAPHEPSSGRANRGIPRRGPPPPLSGGAFFPNFKPVPSPQPGKGGILPKPIRSNTTSIAGQQHKMDWRPMMPVPEGVGDRGSLNTLIDLDESVFGITPKDTFKHTSPEYPSTPPRTANGAAAPWASAGMFFGEDGLSMSPFDLHHSSRPPTSSSMMDYTPPPHRNFPTAANFLLSPPDEDDEFDDGGGGDGDGDDGIHGGDNDTAFWRRAAVDPPSQQVMEGRATQRAVADEMKRLLGSLSGHLSDVGKQVQQLEPRRADGVRPG